MKYCGFCGKPIEGKCCTCEEAVAVNAKQKKFVKRTAIFSGIGVGVLILCCVLFAFISVATMIDPFDYVEVSFTGYNTNGKAEVKCYTRDMVCEIIGYPADAENINEMVAYSAKLDEYLQSVSFSADKNSTLSNGDVVTVTITVTEPAAGKIKSGSKEYVVEGLPEVETVDVFSYVDVTYEGLNGKGRATIKVLDNAPEYVKEYNFYSENTSMLSNGSIVPFDIINVDQIAEKYQVLPKETGREYVVSGLGSYLTTADSISVEQLKEYAVDFVALEKAGNKEDWGITYSEPVYYGIYFMVQKDDASIFSTKNRLEVIISCDMYNRGDYYRTNYSIYEIRDVVVSADGVVEIEYEDFENSIFTTDMDAHLKNSEEDYTVYVLDEQSEE